MVLALIYIIREEKAGDLDNFQDNEIGQNFFVLQTKGNNGFHRVWSKEIEYEVICLDRKTMGINIVPDSGVIVRSPRNVSGGKIKEVVEDKSSWILLFVKI